MARLLRKKGARIAFGATSLGAAAAMMSLLITSGAAYADNVAVLPGSTGSYSVSASAAGLYLALGGQQLTGGTSSVSGTYTNNTGTPAEDAKATGGGFLLSNQVLGTEPSVEAGGTTGQTSASAVQGPQGDPNGSNVDVGVPVPADCAQGGGSVSSGVGGFVGLGCGYAHASVDNGGTSNGPQALAAGNMVTASISLGGVLNQVYTGGAKQLCDGLGQIPTLGKTLDDTCTQVLGTAAGTTNQINPTVQLNVGNAYSEIVGTSSKVFGLAKSSSIDLSVFPGLDSTTEPLLRVEIPAATAISCEGTGCPTGAPNCTVAAGGWTNSYDAGVIKLSGLLIDDLNGTPLSSLPFFSTILGSTTSEFEIPPACSAAGVEQINSSALGQLLTIHLASATVTGTGVSGSGAQVAVTLPGAGQVINLNTSGIQTSNTGTPAATTAAVTPSPVAPVLQAAQSPTSVHTGEWWAGSLPLLAVLAALGGGLLGWPRIRRFPMVSRLVSRSSR